MLKVTNNNTLYFNRENECLSIEPYGPNILRVRVSTESNVKKENWTLISPEEDKAKATLTEYGGLIINGKIKAQITNEGHIKFLDSKDKELLKEQWTLERDYQARIFLGKSSHLFDATITFCAKDGEHFFGMGQESHDVFDLKGSIIDLCQQNTKATIPFVVSSNGYGFLLNNPGTGRAEFGFSGTRWVLDETKQVDYLVFAGDSIPEIVKNYVRVTGYAPSFPKWATGMWQSKLRYQTQDELLTVAREYYKRGIPISMMVCDYFHWPQQGEWKFDKTYWPDPAKMVKELEAMGMKLMVSIWPTVDPRSENYEEMKDNNMLIRTQRGPGVLTFSRGPETYYDATNPQAGDFVWDKVEKNYYNLGIKNFWLDEAEPEFLPYDYDNLRYHLGSGREITNIYPYYYAKNFYDGIKSKNENEVLNLIRCAYTGIQKFGVVLWSGDIEANFDSMRKQLKAGLNVSLCGIPWWTTDIGGFHGGNQESEEYRECIVRWFQFGAFCPIFRMHGNRYVPNKPKVSPFTLDSVCLSGGDNEIWSYGENAYRIMKHYILIREHLRPYISEQLDLASKDGTPVMRPLMYDFNDEECLKIFDQYMFGPDLMPCPIYESNITARAVFLPSKSSWIDAKTGVEYSGNQWVSVDAPLDWMPLFIRKGSKISLDWFKEEK
jgi:alpha-D-xyloside xylohydrolase